MLSSFLEKANAALGAAGSNDVSKTSEDVFASAVNAIIEFSKHRKLTVGPMLSQLEPIRVLKDSTEQNLTEEEIKRRMKEAKDKDDQVAGRRSVIQTRENNLKKVRTFGRKLLILFKINGISRLQRRAKKSRLTFSFGASPSTKMVLNAFARSKVGPDLF